MYLLTEHKKVFNQNPAKRALMDHIKLLQERVNTLEKSIEASQNPLPDLAVDTEVLVWENPEQKRKRHFSHFNNGQMCTFDKGCTSYTASKIKVAVTACWSHWELVE